MIRHLTRWRDWPTDEVIGWVTLTIAVAFFSCGLLWGDWGG